MSVISGEATINMISEDFLEAANFSCIDAPHGVRFVLSLSYPLPCADAPYFVSEWKLAGLTQADTKIVKPKRVAEAVFSLVCFL